MTSQRALVAALHQTVAKLVAEPTERRSAGAPQTTAAALRVRSVRRKPGRGLTAVYATARHDQSPETLVTATVAEDALSSPDFLRKLDLITRRDWRGPPPEIVDGATGGLRVQIFPADAYLPALAAALDVTPASPIHDVMTSAIRELTGDPESTVATAEADVIRYRPGARCVVRYRIAPQSVTGVDLVDEQRWHTVYGKFYRQPSDAEAAHRLAERLWCVTPTGARYLPRPLTFVPDMALVLAEAAGDADACASVAGKKLLQPAAGSAAQNAVRTAADALAWFHTAQVDHGARRPRTAETESDRAKARIELLTAEPAAPGSLRQLGDDLLTALAGADCQRLVLVHGAFRPNQLVYSGPTRAAITDLDGAGSGDPAVDVGDFCAHLRPPGFWSGRAVQRTWWQAANTIFKDRYREAMIRGGAVPSEVAGTLRRSLLFEASAILRMAGHRSRRLSSLRPREVSAMLSEAVRCVAEYEAWPGGSR